VVDIASLHPPVREPGQPMHPYQVRTIQKYFLQELTKRMELQGVSNLAPSFVLLVDPGVVETKHKFVMAKKNTYKYFVLGGDYSACAKMDLARAHPHYDPYKRVSAWIFAGLSVNDARQLSWRHNIDNEFRSTMMTIQRIKYVHMRFVEFGEQQSQELKKECAMEINLKNWGVKKDMEVLNANDNLFQLAFWK
jgi:hypothetical protein